jgi:tetratricopeptide (TPR) repeat protein
LRYNEEAIESTAKFFGDAPNEFKTLVLGNMTSTHVYLLCDAGRYPEAMELSKKMASDVRKNSPTEMTVIQALFGVALTQLYNCLPLDAIATATEAVSLCHMLAKDDLLKFSLLYACSLNLSNGHADLGNVDEAIRHFDIAENAILRHNKVYSIEELDSNESAYSTLLVRRSRLLFAKGDYVRAASGHSCSKIRGHRKGKREGIQIRFQGFGQHLDLFGHSVLYPRAP